MAESNKDSESENFIPLADTEDDVSSPDKKPKGVVFSRRDKVLIRKSFSHLIKNENLVRESKVDNILQSNSDLVRIKKSKVYVINESENGKRKSTSSYVHYVSSVLGCL